KDMEILNGQEIEEPLPDELIFAQRSREQAERARRLDLVRRCANLLPCTDCLHHLTTGQLAELGVARNIPEDGSAFTYDALPGFVSVEESQNERGWGLNR